MTSLRGIFSILAVLAGFAALPAAAGPARAQSGEPCLELRLGGKNALKIPCPEGLAELLDLPLFGTPPEEYENFAIDPNIPDDRDMVITPEWPHDEGMMTRPRTE